MTTLLLAHRHLPGECRSAFAAWHGIDRPLRRQTAISTCRGGGHLLWWTVTAENESLALALLAPFVADRTTATKVWEVQIP